MEENGLDRMVPLFLRTWSRPWLSHTLIPHVLTTRAVHI